MRNLFKSFFGGLKVHQLAIFKLIAICVGIIVLAGIGIYGASYNSKSCTTCHYIKPYYRQWKTSSHSDVRCVKCHPYPPALISSNILRYVTNTYDPRPRAEVEDEVCLQEGCHTERLAESEVTFKKDIIFDHNAHIGKIQRGEKLRCTSCHSQIVQGEHVAVTEKVCFLCHFKGAARGQSITGCPSCHGIPSETVEHEGFTFSHESYMKIGVACDQCHLDVASGTGDVPKDRCFSCHVERTERYEDPVFIHDIHVTEHGVDCFECHTEIEHGEIRMVKALEVQCEACHVRLHTLQKRMYMGVGGKGVSDTPSRMFAAQVSCDGCHTHIIPTGEAGTFAIGEKSLEAEQKACVVCHGAGYDAMLDDWIDVMDHAIKNFEPRLEQARAALEQHRDKEIDLGEAEVLIDDAAYNLDMVKTGKGVHNVEYAVKLLKAGADQIDIAMKYLDPDSKPMERDHLLGTPDGYCATLCHARVGMPEEITLKETKLAFPHEIHAEGIGIECTICHSAEKHKMRIISRDGCMNCHHAQQDIECGKCHSAQETVFRGFAASYGLPKDIPGSMSEEIECINCHDLEVAGPILGNVREKCIECHDEEYGDMLIEWEQAYQEPLDDLTLLLEQARESLDRASRAGVDLAELEKQYELARHIFNTIEKGKGVHNIEYTDVMLSTANEKLRTVIAQTRP